MQIIGLNFTKILIERDEKTHDKVEIKQNIGVDDISKDKINISKEEILRLKFTYSVGYNNDDLAKIEIKGQIAFLPEKDELKKFLNSWKNKQLPEDVKIPLFNFIKTKCDVKALGLEDDFGLPLHIQFPRLTNKKPSN